MIRLLRHLLLYGLLTVAMVAAGLAALDRMVMPRLVLHGQEHPVPDVSGLDFPAAADSLQARGFRAVIGGHEPHGEYPLGVVVSQEPPAGSPAKPSRTIRVILAAGPAMVAVPVLSRMGCREAMAALSQAGLCVGDILMARAEWSSIGQVLATSPQEGESVLRGSEIDLLVAGPQQAECFIVPDFVGRPVSDVVQELRTSGIPLGLRTFVSGAGAREGTVYSTDPPAGFRICKGESLSVVVAS